MSSVEFVNYPLTCINSCLPIYEVAWRQARKAFLALSQDEGLEIASSKLDEEDSGNVPDLPADDDNHFTKSTPVRFCPCLSNK